MVDIAGMMKQAQAMQQRMAAAQAELEATIVNGEAGGGVVKIALSAKGELKSISIDPSLLKPEEAEILEDLIVSAHAQARVKAEEAMTEKMKAVTGGLQLPPGLKLPF
ncbi:MAG TPA: YbaB/EbfC family nucleoid-associated protein [Methylocystis sp.]|nr:YbaB/EbfC family nucleoid-associated protein [Methylocystis sp.]